MLLAFLLILIAGASYMLINRLNKVSQTSSRDAQTQTALKQAKEILIGYAVTYPESHAGEGPGYLPCPDITNNGLSGTNGLGSCSIAGGTSLRRFPHVTLEMNNITDASGETLWYAVSDNFRNNSKLVPLNSETPGTLSLDRNADGVADEDDLVAVIIAPGDSFNGQDRDLDDNAVANYLEGENADGDTVFSIAGSGDFNDQVIAITRGELMQAVEKRVLGEAAGILTAYRNQHDPADTANPDSIIDRYPWLSRFADPKVMTPLVVKGKATSTIVSTSPTLVDSKATFIARGVASGDVIVNITNPSVGRVVTVDSETQITASSMSGVASGEFVSGDEYVIRPSGASFIDQYSGTAGAASSGNVLADSSTSHHFGNLGISAGLVIENLSSTFAGVIEQLDPDEDGSNYKLSFVNPAASSFAAGDDYRVRMNIGTATSGSSALALEDDTRLVDPLFSDFEDMGVVEGDIIENLTDGSIGSIASVSGDTITANDLQFGTTNSFSDGDVYLFSRFNGISGIREGLLPLHQYGMPFATSFTVEWELPTTGTTISTAPLSTDPAFGINSTRSTDYWTFYELRKRTAITRNVGGAITERYPVTVAASDGACVWFGRQIADCRGMKSGPYLSGTVDGVANGGRRLDDVSQKFLKWGVQAGDIVYNYSESVGTPVPGSATGGSTDNLLEDTSKDFNALEIKPGNFIVKNTTTVEEGVVTEVTNTTLAVMNMDGGRMSFTPGDSYSVEEITRGAISEVSETTIKSDNLTDGNRFQAGDSYGVSVATEQITGTADTASPSGSNWILTDSSYDFPSDEGVLAGDTILNTTSGEVGTITLPLGPSITTDIRFNTGDDYTIRHHFVAQRQYEFRLRYKADTTTIAFTNGVRARKLDLDASTLPAQIEPLVRVTDTLRTGQTFSTSVAIPDSASLPTGSLFVSGIQYDLDTDDDIPSWFVDNDWHRLVYISVAAPLSPGGGGACTAGTNCLTIGGVNGKVANDGTNDSVVISMGRALGTQDRTTGLITDFLEGENSTAGDDVYEIENNSTTYNDQIRIVE